MSTDSRPSSSHAGSKPGGGWTPPTVEELQALLPQYEIVSMLGHGGMGAVYKGRQKSLDRIVAIKILPPGLDNDDAKFVERFQNEARTMAKLNHPGIVSVYDFGETAEGQLYFIMEYVDGTDVAKMIQSSGKLPQDYALAITAHVCDALGYAHANGVVHRDIKPANILINMQGQIKVADFGLAKIDDPTQSGLTKTGYAMGTPDYVSPEALIMGSSIDGRADLYAVGVMLYQMLTGEVPRGLFQMPNIRTKGETDPRFDAIISKAMQTDRESRYQTAMDLRRALDIILSTPHIKQDASKAVAAVPQQAVDQTPGKRSAVAVKPGTRGPKPPQGSTDHAADRNVRAPARKSPPGLWLGFAVVVVVVGGIAFMLSGDKPKPATAVAPPSSAKAVEVPKSKPPPVSSPTPKPAPAISAVAVSSDGWIDGLAEWLAVPGNVAQGTLQQEGTVWRFKGPESIRFGSRLPQPKKHANAAVRLTFKQSGNSAVTIKLRGDNKGNGYQAQMWRTEKAEITRSDAGQFTTLASKSVPGYDPEKTHLMEFRAEGDQLTLILDGVEQAMAQDTTYASGEIFVMYGIYEKIEYRDLGGTPAVAGAPKASATSDGWIDGLAEWLAVPGNATKNTLQKEGDAWRYKGPSSVGLGARLSPPYQLSNVAVRLTSKGGPGSIGLRDQGGDGNYYLAIQGYPDFEIRRSQNKESTILAKFKAPAGFKRDASYVMEFRAEGDVLTLSVDGQTLGSVKDTTYASGKFHVSPLNALIEKLEYRDLGSAPAAVVAPVKAAAAAMPPAPTALPVVPPPATQVDPKLTALLQNYTKAITNGLAAAVPTDKAAFETELTRLKNSAPLPAEDATTLPAELKRLRGILRTQIGSLAPPQVATTPADKSQPLFDGSTLTGWLVGGDPASFKVEDGCIHAAGPKGNLIYSGTGAAPAWTDFDLTMKIKTGKKANSGVWIHCPAQATGENAVALEVQIANDPSTQMTGSLFGIVPITEQVVPNDQWFDLRVVVRGMTVTVYVDGGKINEWTSPADWTPPAKVPHARLGSGTIGFQGYGGETWIKDVRITLP